MIEKIDLIGYNGTAYQLIQDKINEIIDHLPQEEVLCPKCDGGADKQPTKEVCTCPKVKGVISSFCEKCGKPIEYKIEPTKEVPDILNAIKEIMIQLYYEELHPINENTTAKDLENRKEKAIDEYLGKNQKPIFYPILHAKVDRAMAHIAQEISALYRKENDEII